MSRKEIGSGRQPCGLHQWPQEGALIWVKGRRGRLAKMTLAATEHPQPPMTSPSAVATDTSAAGARAARKSRWPARLDWTQSASGLVLALFMFIWVALANRAEERRKREAAAANSSKALMLTAALSALPSIIKSRPLLLASVEPFFDPNEDAWFDLDLERRNGTSQVLLRKRDFVRHGDVSDWLTSEAFDLKIARSVEAEEAISKALDLLAQPERHSAAEVRQVDESLRAVLSDIDRFWVRWSAFAEELIGAES
jgi:hypothetical protein